jgi:hypothetical protein
MKGPESITGKKNGFLNIAPALGKAAKVFAKDFVLTDPPSGIAYAPFPVYPEPLPIYPVTPPPCMNWNCGGLTPFPVPGLPVTIGTDKSAFDYMSDTSFATFETFQDKPLLPFPNMSLNNDLGGLCPIGTACRQKLSIGDLNGAFNEMMNNLPEDARPR